MTLKTFEIFKVGTHRTMGGETLTFTANQLQTTAACFSESIRPAPLCEGHPASDSPAYGWVKGVDFSSGRLFATADFSESLVSNVKRGAYRGVSAKFVRPEDPKNPAPGSWYLAHVGFLKTANPAVKGLAPIAFSEFTWDGRSALELFSPSQLTVEFSESQRGDGVDPQRAALHEGALTLVKKYPGMSYAAAAHKAAEIWDMLEKREAQKSQSTSVATYETDPDRVAFHEAAIDYQLTVPGATYAGAVQRIFSSTKAKTK